MDLRYIRLKVFWFFLGPVSRRVREKRMRLLCRTMDIKDGTSILDLGGYPKFWDSLRVSLDLTILNLPGELRENVATNHKLRCIEGDACDVHDIPDRTFGLVFSNSVIEHVGSAERRASFAREVRRLGRSYWVQTPSIWFPIEAHSGMLFWFFYPERLRRFFFSRWRKLLQGNEAWNDMIEGTTVLSRSELEHLFPESNILVEKLFGIPKSYIAYFVNF